MAPHDLLDFDPSPPAAPWWVRPLYAFGIPAAIAAFLVWFLATVVVAGQAKVQETLEAHTRDAAEQHRTLTAICLILADGDRVRESWCGGQR